MNVQNDVESRESGEEQRSEFRKVRKKISKENGKLLLIGSKMRGSSIIFLYFCRWLVVIDLNLNLSLKLFFYSIITISNNLLPRIYCENIVDMSFLFYF